MRGTGGSARRSGLIRRLLACRLALSDVRVPPISARAELVRIIPRAPRHQKQHQESPHAPIVATAAAGRHLVSCRTALHPPP